MLNEKSKPVLTSLKENKQALQVRGLFAGYNAHKVLFDINFSLPIGKNMAVLGRNGAGKTTLIKTLLGFTWQQKGTICLFNTAIQGLETGTRVQLGLGWVPQERGAFPSLTVQEHLSLVARPGIWHLDKIYMLFPRLAERANHLGGALSGGEQQMLVIARALMLNPKVLLLDEPFEGLAPMICQQLIQVLHYLRQETNMQVVIVEQQVNQVLDLTDLALVLERGQVRYFGCSQSLKAKPEALESWLGVVGTKK